MSTVIEIKTVEDVSRLILDQDYNPEIDRLRSHYLFRGMPDANFSMLTSLRRNCKQKQQFLEPSLLKSFARYASISEDSVWEQMTIGQHHGLPTRLLDWSHSALIALHFATSENDMADTDKRDGAVWRIDAREIAQRLPEAYKKVLERENTVKYIISRDIRWEIRDLLDQFNISERIIYPGLDGLSRWIGRHYYVK